MIRALFFDFDGLILDTEYPEFQSWEEVFAAHGCTLGVAEWSAGIGRSVYAQSFDPYAHLEAQLRRPVERATLRDARRKRYAEPVAAQATRPGVDAYVADARRLGLKLGVASSGTGDWVGGHLYRLGLMAHFDCVRCAEDVTRAKPDPELYRSVLRALALTPDEAIAIEDSPNGVRAAKAAGLFCVAVPNPLTRRLPLDHADLRLASLADLTLGTLLTRVQERPNRPE